METLGRPRFYRTAVWSFAGFAFLPAISGIFGIVSYAVFQGTHEIGIRLALGATPARVRAAILGQEPLPVAIGAGSGVVGGVLSARLLQALVEGVKPAGAGIYLGAILLVFSIAAFGCLGGHATHRQTGYRGGVEEEVLRKRC